MAIRIWHQSFTVLSDLAAYDDALRAHFKRVARPDTKLYNTASSPAHIALIIPATISATPRS